jgi:hypothetical protein
MEKNTRDWQQVAADLRSETNSEAILIVPAKAKQARSEDSSSPGLRSETP